MVVSVTRPLVSRLAQTMSMWRKLGADKRVLERKRTNNRQRTRYASERRTA